MATSIDSSDTYCSVLYFDLAAGMTFSFDEGRNGILDRIKGTLISEKEIRLGEYAGREVKISAASGDTAYVVRARFYLVDRRVYLLQLLVTKPSDGPTADEKSVKFFTSFQLAKPH